MSVDEKLIQSLSDDVLKILNQMDITLSSNRDRIARLEICDRGNLRNNEYIDKLSSLTERIDRLEKLDSENSSNSKHMSDTLSSLTERIDRLEKLDSENSSNSKHMKSLVYLNVERIALLEELYNENSSNIKHTSDTLSSLTERIYRLEHDSRINYFYASGEVVASLRKEAKSMNKFALALEEAVYDKDNTGELNLPVSQRKLTKDKVEFIKQCLLEHYNVPEAEAEEVWRKARDALTSRATRGHKKVAQAVQRARPE